MKKHLLKFLLALFLFAGWQSSFGQVFITELADPNNDAGLRYIELYNAGGTDVDFTEGSGWRIDKYTNASATVSQTLALTGTIPAGGFYIIATGIVDGDFLTAYGIDADQFDGADNDVAGSNGDDNLELYNGSNTLIDQFGVPGEDGNATPTTHEFEDGRAERKETVTTGNTTWDVNEWNIDNDGTTYPGDGPQDAPAGFDPGSWIGEPVADTPPQATFNPANAETFVAIDANITITFDEKIYTSGGVTEIVDGDLATLITLKETDAAGADVAFSATYSNADPFVITIDPTTNLNNGAGYYVAFGPVFDDANQENTGENATFTTIPTNYIQLTNPVGGEKYYAGDEITIAWDYANVTTVDIFAFIPTQGWLNIVNDTPCDGSEAFTIPSDADYSALYKIAVMDITDTTVMDSSDVYTIIATPTINTIQSDNDGDASWYDGQIVRSSGIVTAIDGSNYWVQDGDGAYNGVIFYDSGNAGSLTVGDSVTFEGTVDEYFNLTEMTSITSLTINNSGNTLPNSSTITTVELVEEYEGVLVDIVNAEITNADAGNGMFEINDGSGALLVDDDIYKHTATLGDNITIYGIGHYSYGDFKILPRSVNDVVSATDTVGSSVYTVDQIGLTITDVPFSATLTEFEANITAADSATFDTYLANGTTLATTDVQTDYKVIVTAADGITKATYTITKSSALSSDATVSSTVYTVDNGLETITNIPLSTDLATFESNISPATGATFDTYEANGTTVATDLASDYKVIVTAEDASTKTYTITLNAANTDATLSDLTVDGVTVIGFAPSTLTYNVELSFGTTVVPTVVAFENDIYADAVVTPADNVTGTELERTTTIVVTAEDGSTQLTYKIIFSVGAETGDLFISEYVEGTSNNRAIEIYNPNATSVDLGQYVIKQSHNGTGWGVDGDGDIEYELPLSGTLAAGEVYVVANAGASAEILALADISLDYGTGQGQKVPSFTGDDALGLFKNDVLVDVIGIPTEDPGDGWDVAGTILGTVDHTLLRKYATTIGNTDWTISAGTTAENSEWKVKDMDYIANLGLFTEVSNVALITSSVYTVDNTLETITGVPFSTSLADFESNITGTDGATFETYESNGTTVATSLATGYKVIVTAEDETTQKTYTITLDAASTDATLSNIKIDGGLLSNFDPATFSYTKELAAGTTVTPTVTATPTFDQAQVDIDPAADVTSTTEAERTTTITVTAEDGVTQEVYTIVFNVATTGINELSAGFKIYPNPSNGMFKLELNNATNDTYEVEVYDVIGKMVYRSQITESITNINLTYLNNGLYYVSVNKGEERNVTKIMIQ